MNVQITQILADTVVKLGTLVAISYGLKLLFRYLEKRADTLFAPKVPEVSE